MEIRVLKIEKHAFDQMHVLFRDTIRVAILHTENDTPPDAELQEHPWSFGSFEEQVCRMAELIPTGSTATIMYDSGGSQKIYPPSIQIEGKEIRVQQRYRTIFHRTLN